MSTIREVAQALLDIPQISFTERGCVVVRTEVEGGEHIELSTMPKPVILHESPPCVGHALPLSLAPDFLRERGRVWPSR